MGLSGMKRVRYLVVRVQKKKKKTYKRACEGHRVRSGYAVLEGQRYIGVRVLIDTLDISIL